MKKDKRIIQWIDVVLNELSKLKDNKGVDILHLCGGNCSMLSTLLEGAEKIRNENLNEKNIDKLFEAFKSQYYDKPELTKQGNEIILVFKECTCPIAKSGINNSYLCNCTVGYTHNIFETLFNRKIKVKLEQSVLKGDKICRQIINII